MALRLPPSGPGLVGVRMEPTWPKPCLLSHLWVHQNMCPQRYGEHSSASALALLGSVAHAGRTGPGRKQPPCSVTAGFQPDDWTPAPDS